MGDVLTFTLRPKPAAPEPPELLTGPALRASLEEAAQTALDAADRIIAVLDRLDGDVDHEDGAESHEGSQVVYMRGGDQDCEAEAPEIALPEVATEAVTAPNVIQVPPMRWGGQGNVIAAAGTALLDLVGVR